MKQEEFFDEQVIDLINAQKEKGDNPKSHRQKMPEEERSIYTGIKILGKRITFERRLLAENKITIMVPGDFAPMNPEAAEKKYPSQQRPETILADDTGTVNLLFQYMEGEEEDETIENFRSQIFGMMKRVNPGIKEQELGTVEVSGKRIAYAEFSNPAIDGKLYNLMFYLAVEGRPLMGSFNCRTKDMKYWRKAAFEMMESIELAKPKE